MWAKVRGAFLRLPLWGRVVVIIAAGAALGLALAGAWEALGVLVSSAAGLRPAARGAKALSRKAKALRKTADAAAELGDALTEATEAHAAEDAQADAELRAAAVDEAEARHAEPPADELEPMRFDALEGE